MKVEMEFKSKAHGEGAVIGYRSAPEKGDYRMDVVVVRPDGQLEIITNLCRCWWCCKTCSLQNSMAGLGRAYHFGFYLPGTGGEWVFRSDLPSELVERAERFVTTPTQVVYKILGGEEVERKRYGIGHAVFNPPFIYVDSATIRFPFKHTQVARVLETAGKVERKPWGSFYVVLESFKWDGDKWTGYLYPKETGSELSVTYGR